MTKEEADLIIMAFETFAHAFEVLARVVIYLGAIISVIGGGIVIQLGKIARAIREQ